MRRKFSALLIVALSVAACRHRTISPATAYGPWAQDKSFEDSESHSVGNGIDVGRPRIYDDASLRILLDQARTRLAAVNGLNEATLVAHLGAVTGSRLDQTQFGLQVSGPAIPGVSTVAAGGTQQTTSNVNPPSALPSSVIVSAQPTQTTTTTASGVTSPTPPAVPATLAFTPPSGMSVSALDLLNEQMQLTNEIAGLQLMLEGPLSDRFVDSQRFIKPRATIGFPISLSPPQRYKYSVAVVEVEVQARKNRLSNEPPGITALLPREKTYNVAAIKDRVTSIGGGAATAVVGVSGSWLSGHKTYYVVRDQDTVALSTAPRDKNSQATMFEWRFLPVLGEPFVRSGTKETFVQLAFPVAEDAPPDCLGTVRIRTYWRDFDRKTGLVKTVIPGSVLVRNVLPIPRYDLSPQVSTIDTQDLGDGNLRVRVVGPSSFWSGVYVQLGPQRYDASNGLVVDDQGLTFTAPAGGLARWTAKIVSRDGKRTSVVNPGVEQPLPDLEQTSCSGSGDGSTQATREKEAKEGRTAAATLPACPQGVVHIESIVTKPMDPANTQITVNLKPDSNANDILLDIGHNIYGLSDTASVVRRDPAVPAMTVVVPTALLNVSPSIRAFRMFATSPEPDAKVAPASACNSHTVALAGFPLAPAQDKLTHLSTTAKGDATFLLTGSNLQSVTTVLDKTANISDVDGADGTRFRLVTLSKDQLKASKKLVLRKAADAPPFVLDVPQGEAKPLKVVIDSPVVVNTTSLEVSWENAGPLESVKMGDKTVPFIPKDETSARLINLREVGVTTEQSTRELTFTFKDASKTSVKLDVVAARVGVKQQ